MKTVRIRRSKVREQCCHNNFESWLGRQHIAEAEEKRILAEWHSWPGQTPSRLFPTPRSGHELHLVVRPSGNLFDPSLPSPTSVAGPVGEATRASEIPANPETARKFEEWISYLAKTTYQVAITNTSGGDIGNLTVIYSTNTLIAGRMVTTGPLSKSMEVPLPDGKSVGFDLCPCLNMASKYKIFFVYLDSSGTQQEQYFDLDVDELNKQELLDFGKVAFCSDTLEIGVF